MKKLLCALLFFVSLPAFALTHIHCVDNTGAVFVDEIVSSFSFATSPTGFPIINYTKPDATKHVVVNSMCLIDY